MDPVTLAYPKEQFNKLRMALGFKQEAELTTLVEKAEAFRIVRHKQTGEMMAFMTPLVPDRFQPTDSQEIVEPKIESEVFYCKADAMTDKNGHDKIAENLRIHKNGINMKMLLAGNVPKFHATPNKEAQQRIRNILQTLFDTPELRHQYFYEFLYHYRRKYRVDERTAYEVLVRYLINRVINHMASRVGIANWQDEAITQWLKNYFGAKKLEYVITDANEIWMKQQNNRQK